MSNAYGREHARLATARGVARGLWIGIARRLRWGNQVRFFAVSLVLAGAFYLALGTFQGPRWIALEGTGFVLYSSLAYVGLRRPRVLALGWLLHVAWDSGLHLALEQPVVGPWLPLLCLPFDVMVAAYVAHTDSRQPAA